MTRSKFTSDDGSSSRADAIHANKRESHASSVCFNRSIAYSFLKSTGMPIGQPPPATSRFKLPLLPIKTMNISPNPLKNRHYQENAVHLLTKAVQYPQSFRGGRISAQDNLGGLMVRLL